MKYTGRPHDGGGRGPSDEDGLRASNIFEGGPSPEQRGNRKRGTKSLYWRVADHPISEGTKPGKDTTQLELATYL